MQSKIQQILVTSLFLLISTMFIDAGMLIGNNTLEHLISDHHNDLEIPHQHKHNISVDDEKLVNLNFFDLSCSVNNCIQVSCNNILKTVDYSVAIWQPPKSN